MRKLAFKNDWLPWFEQQETQPSLVELKSLLETLIETHQPEYSLRHTFIDWDSMKVQALELMDDVQPDHGSLGSVNTPARYAALAVASREVHNVVELVVEAQSSKVWWLDKERSAKQFQSIGFGNKHWKEQKQLHRHTFGVSLDLYLTEKRSFPDDAGLNIEDAISKVHRLF